jgi:hypothetical protein
MKACAGMFGLGLLVVVLSISVLWGVNPASAKFCGCHSGSQWKSAEPRSPAVRARVSANASQGEQISPSE